MHPDIPSFLTKKALQPAMPVRGHSRTLSQIDRGIAGFARIIHYSFIQCELASRRGVLQSLDARIKVSFWIALIVTISLKTDVFSLSVIAAAITLLAVLSRVSLLFLYGRVIPLAFFFGFLVSAPAMLNVISTGRVVLPLFELSRPYAFWIYFVPQHIGITDVGINICAKLTLRVFASLSLSFLVVATTSFPEIVRALKLFRLPDSILLILTLTYKYVYLFALTITDMYRAKKARLVLGTSASEFRQWSAGRMVTVFRRTERRVDDIYRAMLSRGFSGELRLLAGHALKPLDMVGAVVLTFIVLAALLV